MRAHIAALFAHDDQGRMTYVNEPGGGRAPRFFLGRTGDGVEWRVREDLDDPSLLHDLQALAERDRRVDDDPLQPEPSAPYEQLLSAFGPIQNVWTGPAFCFTSQLVRSARTILVTEANASVLAPHLEPWLADVAQHRLLFALVVHGEAVAICGSVRTTSLVHEAGVETVAAFRGHGYASEVVAAWARAVREIGAAPLYSTSWANVASRAVARKLGLRLFGTDLHIT